MYDGLLAATLTACNIYRLLGVLITARQKYEGLLAATVTALDIEGLLPTWVTAVGKCKTPFTARDAGRKQLRRTTVASAAPRGGRGGQGCWLQCNLSDQSVT